MTTVRSVNILNIHNPLLHLQVDIPTDPDRFGRRVLRVLQNQTGQRARRFLLPTTEHKSTVHRGQRCFDSVAIPGRGWCRNVLGSGSFLLCDIATCGLLQH